MDYIIYPVDTVGCYAKDAEGNPWATFEMINVQLTCSECSMTIQHGWARGKHGEEVYMCSSHVQVVRQSEQLRTYWAGDTTGEQCDVPECPHMAKSPKSVRPMKRYGYAMSTAT